MLKALRNGGAHLDFRARDGMTALHRAARARNLPALQVRQGRVGVGVACSVWAWPGWLLWAWPVTDPPVWAWPDEWFVACGRGQGGPGGIWWAGPGVWGELRGGASAGGGSCYVWACPGLGLVCVCGRGQGRGLVPGQAKRRGLGKMGVWPGEPGAWPGDPGAWPGHRGGAMGIQRRG